MQWFQQLMYNQTCVQQTHFFLKRTVDKVTKFTENIKQTWTPKTYLDNMVISIV